MRTAGRLRREQESPETVSNAKKNSSNTTSSSADLPTVQYTKAIKNWTVGRPGNKATYYHPDD